MSKKPPKKSDLDKDWMKPRKSKNISIRPEYHLIVTEGTKTEPQYFSGMKEVINKKYPGRISIRIEGEGKNTLDLLEAAKQYVKDEQNPISHVWLVYDKDDFPNDRFNLTESECKKLSNDDITYHALWSNQCIELWFLLHFIYFDTDIIREKYYEKLSEILKKEGLGKYKKKRGDIYSILSSRRNIAIKNAKTLERTYGTKVPSQMSPMTKVYELLVKLDYYLRE